MRTLTKADRLQSQQIQFGRLIERGYTHTTYKGLNIFTRDEYGKFFLMVFRDTSANVEYNYYHTSEESRNKKVEEFKTFYDRREQRKAEAKANRVRSSQAQCADAIREELKKNFPGTKFSVKSDSFAGGDAVRISWVDGPTTNQVDDITEKYQYGSFNGMEDMYEYTNTREDIPQAKYVQTHRDKSEETERMISDKLRGTWGHLPEYEFSRMVHQEFYKLDLSPKTEKAPAPVVTPEKVEVPAGEVQIIEYSEKAIAVIGDTKSIKDKLKELGGKFNFRLTCGAGWIFPKTKLTELQTALTQ